MVRHHRLTWVLTTLLFSSGLMAQEQGSEPPDSTFFETLDVMLINAAYFDAANLDTDRPITAEDLGGIALSVEESLDDIPNHNASAGKKAYQMSPFEWFSGARKEKLKDFVQFCREAEIIDL